MPSGPNNSYVPRTAVPSLTSDRLDPPPVASASYEKLYGMPGSLGASLGSTGRV